MTQLPSSEHIGGAHCCEFSWAKAQELPDTSSYSCIPHSTTPDNMDPVKEQLWLEALVRRENETV